MIQEFNNLPWHDAELKKITLARYQNDNIKIQIRWPEDFGAKDVSIEFLNCYGFYADMHFGFTPPDYILDAECFCESQELDKIKSVWKEMGLDLSKLFCFKINTNSTNSIINIFALGFRIINES